MQTYRLDRVYKSLVIIVIATAILVFLKDIFIPLAFSALFSMVLLPVARIFEKRTGRITSIVLVLLAALVFLGLITWFVIYQITDLVANLPSIENRLLQTVNDLSRRLHEQYDISSAEQTQIVKDALKELTSYTGSFLASTTYLVYFFVQVPIYIFLFLLYREKFQEFFVRLTAKKEMKWQSEIEDVVRGYISGLLIVVFIAGVLNSIGLLALGIDHAIFFGFLSGALTMIPYVGITIGAALPTLLALVTKDSIWYAVGVVGVHGFVQFLEGNFISPKVTGSKISINALAAILALLVGGKIWGIPGMILAVPAVGVLKSIMAYSRSWSPFVVLLEDKSPEVPAGAAEERREELP